jgi:hypothetical protein
VSLEEGDGSAQEGDGRRGTLVREDLGASRVQSSTAMWM